MYKENPKLLTWGVYSDALIVAWVERKRKMDFSSHPLFPNVNGIHNHNELQVNDNVSYMEKKQRAAAVRSTARTVADKLGEPQNINFFMKAVWALPEARIMSNLEQSLTKKKPGAYFVTLCKMEMPE